MIYDREIKLIFVRYVRDPAVVAWSVKASNSHSVEVCTSALSGLNPTQGYNIDRLKTEMCCCEFQFAERWVAYSAYYIEPSLYCERLYC